MHWSHFQLLLLLFSRRFTVTTKIQVTKNLKIFLLLLISLGNFGQTTRRHNNRTKGRRNKKKLSITIERLMSDGDERNASRGWPIIVPIPQHFSIFKCQRRSTIILRMKIKRPFFCAIHSKPSALLYIMLRNTTTPSFISPFDCGWMATQYNTQMRTD